MAAIEIPARMGYAGGSLKGLHGVLEELAAAIDSSSDVMGTDATVSEMDTLHDVAAGTVTGSKAIVAGASKNVDVLAVADLKLGVGAGTSVTATAVELNKNAGVTAGVASASKVAVLGANKNLDTLRIAKDGLLIDAVPVTITAAEANLLDDTVAGTSVASKVLALGASKNTDVLGLPVGGLKIGAGGAEVAVTASAAELNKLTGATALTADINKLAGTSAGVAVASKAAILGANKNLDVLGLPVGGLKIGPAGSEVVVTPSAAELNILKGCTVTAAELNQLAVLNTDDSVLWVSTDGADDTGTGSVTRPLASLTAALAAASAARPIIYMLGGEYEEAAMVTWPNVTGLSVVGLGEVSVSNVGTGTAVIKIAPTFTASTFEASLKDINISANAQIGIQIANAAMTRKLNVYLSGVSTEYDTSGDSVDVAGTVSGQAVRVYVKNCDFEGLVHFTVNDAGSRLRCENTSFVGGITAAGAVAAENTFRNCQILKSGVSWAAEQKLTNVACLYATNADPAVYTAFVDAYATY